MRRAILLCLDLVSHSSCVRCGSLSRQVARSHIESGLARCLASISVILERTVSFLAVTAMLTLELSICTYDIIHLIAARSLPTRPKREQIDVSLLVASTWHIDIFCSLQSRLRRPRPTRVFRSVML